MGSHSEEIARAAAHLSLNVGAAFATGTLTYCWIMTSQEIKEWSEYSQIPSTVVFGATLMLLSTYHRGLQLTGHAESLLHHTTRVFVIASWAVAGFLTSRVFGEGLVFYGFLIPALKHATSSETDRPKKRPKHVVCKDPWYVRLIEFFQNNSWR